MNVLEKQQFEIIDSIGNEAPNQLKSAQITQLAKAIHSIATGPQDDAISTVDLASRIKILKKIDSTHAVPERTWYYNLFTLCIPYVMDQITAYKILNEKQVVIDQCLAKMFNSTDPERLTDLGNLVNDTNAQTRREIVKYALKNNHRELLKKCRESQILHRDESSNLEQFVLHKHHSLASLKEFIAQGFNINVYINDPDSVDYATALGMAVKRQKHEEVEIYLKAGAYDGNALCMAVQRGDRRIVSKFIEAGVDLNEVGVTRYGCSFNGCTPLVYAIYRGRTEIAKQLIQAKAGLTDGTLAYAVSSNRPDLALKLLEAGANPSQAYPNCGMPLQEAISKGYTELALKLIKKNAQVHGRDLVRTLELDQLDVANALLDSDKIDKKFYGPALAVAVMHGQTAMVTKLLGLDADLNFKTPNHQETPLVVAARHGRVAITNELIRAHAELNAQSVTGHTALTSAIENKHPDIALNLMKAGADINLATPAGETPLILAATQGQMAVTAELIRKQAAINAQTVDGYTALMRAIEQGFPNIALSLIQAGADIDLETKSGKTALALAEEKSQLSVIDALMNRKNGLNFSPSPSDPPAYGATPSAPLLSELDSSTEKNKINALLKLD